MVDREPRKINRREFLRLSGGALAGLVAGAAVDKFGGKKVEAAPLTEVLPEKISWRSYLPERRSHHLHFQNCASFNAAQLLIVAKIVAGDDDFRQGIVNMGSAEVNSEYSFNAAFFTGIAGIESIGTSSIRTTLKEKGCPRNNVSPGYNDCMTMGSITMPPTIAQYEDARNNIPRQVSYEYYLQEDMQTQGIDPVVKIKEGLSRGPILLGFPALANWRQYRDENIIVSRTPDQAYVTGHAMVAFEYDDNYDNKDGTRGAVLLLNDQGDDWGEPTELVMPYHNVRDVVEAPESYYDFLDVLYVGYKELPHRVLIPFVSKSN